MKMRFSRSQRRALLAACIIFSAVFVTTKDLSAQLPSQLEARYSVERITISEPLQAVTQVEQIRVDVSDLDNPYAIVVGVFKRSEADLYGHGYIYDHFGTINANNTRRLYALDQLPGTSFPPAWAGPSFTESKCFGLNSSGIVTGYLADPMTREHLAFYLNLYDPNLEIREIPAPADRLVGGTSFSGGEVNEAGQILVRYLDVNHSTKTFVFDAATQMSTPLPDQFNGTLKGINSLGDVFGGNNFDGTGIRYNIYTGVTDDIDDSLTSISAVNEFGQFVGEREVTDYRGKDRDKNGNFVTRYGSNLQVEFDTRVQSRHASAYSLNLSGDFTFDSRTDGYPSLPSEIWIYLGEWGELRLQDLVQLGNPGDASDELLNCQTLTNPRLSDRDSTGMGWIACMGQTTGTELPQALFLLVPCIPGQTPGISIAPTNGLTTTEQGDLATFDVVLNTEPTADVTIGFGSSNTLEGTVDPASLTFTPINWDLPQTVTITGVDDLTEDGDMAYTIITAAATSTDTNYDGLDADDVSVTNLDDDAPPGGGSETYSVTDDPNWEPLAIPDNDPGGVASYIEAGDHPISNLTVNVDITHQRPSDLEVYLIGPDGGPLVQLFNFSGDNVVTDFNGTSSSELWTLEVYDTRNKKTGILNGWSITVESP